MDPNEECMVETATGNQKYCHKFIKKTLQCLVPVSLCSLLFSYYSGFTFFSYNLQFSTLIFSLSAQALDRKYMLLICTGILALLARNWDLSSSTTTTLSMKSDGDDDIKQQISELPQLYEEATAQENVASVEYASDPTNVAAVEEEKRLRNHEQDYGGFKHGDDEEQNTADFALGGDDWEDEGDDNDDDEVVKESIATVGKSSSMEEISDASVSTEELNQRIEKFIRKMKEEIRIESQQPLITV